MTSWLAAAGLVGLCVLGQVFLAAPRIEEGHNVFLVDGPGGALEKTLPGPVFRFMQAAFDAQYPPERRCDRQAVGCWRNQGLPDRPFAFSADGIYDRPLYSRRVTGIDLADPVWAGLGFINEARYNWYGGVSDISRLQRERRFWMVLHPWRLTMPWYVMFQFPEPFRRQRAVLARRCPVGRRGRAVRDPAPCGSRLPDDRAQPTWGAGYSAWRSSRTRSP